MACETPVGNGSPPALERAIPAFGGKNRAATGRERGPGWDITARKQLPIYQGRVRAKEGNQNTVFGGVQRICRGERFRQGCQGCLHGHGTSRLHPTRSSAQDFSAMTSPCFFAVLPALCWLMRARSTPGQAWRVRLLTLLQDF